jgi:hypothetical protein
MTDEAAAKDPDDKLFDARFVMNMQRINALVGLVVPRSLAAQSDPLESDISRAVVVFLHATFEDMLRTIGRSRVSGTRTEGPDSYWDYVSITSYTIVEKTLLRVQIDPEPFKFLAPGLDSMIERRHQIVHDADLPNPTAREAPPWSIADTLLLVYWLLHVVTFNAQLHVSIDPADELHRWYVERRRVAVEGARDAIRGGREATKLPKESVQSGVQRMFDLLSEVLPLLGPPSDEEVQEIARKMEAGGMVRKWGGT